MTPGVDLRPWIKIKARYEAGEKVDQAASSGRRLAEWALRSRVELAKLHADEAAKKRRRDGHR